MLQRGSHGRGLFGRSDKTLKRCFKGNECHGTNSVIYLDYFWQFQVQKDYYALNIETITISFYE